MEQRGSWTQHSTSTLMQRRFFTVRTDETTHPGGGQLDYDWIDAPDMVRVAAVTDAGELFIVEQTHYLPGQILWQLPGGGIGEGESPEQAAERELLEETGFRASSWISYGSVWPLPGLTGTRVHLFGASGLSGDGRQDLEASEADLVLRRVQLGEAVKTISDGGLLRCAPSAQLILMLSR